MHTYTHTHIGCTAYPSSLHVHLIRIHPWLCIPSYCPRLYFKTVFYGGDSELISQLVTVLLERIIILYSIPSFQGEVRRYGDDVIPGVVYWEHVRAVM